MPCKSKMTMSKISELSSHTYMYVFNHMDTKYVDWNIWMTFCQFGDEVNRLCIQRKEVKKFDTFVPWIFSFVLPVVLVVSS